jgi:UDP-N-acetylmuramoylalanine--D-glutamate ligase
MSDRQLSFGFSLSPDIVVVTNVSPNKHMDDYGGFGQYVKTKSHLLAFQNASQTAVLCADNISSREILAGIGAAKRLWVSSQEQPARGGWIHDDALLLIEPPAQRRLARTADLKISGPHNYINALLAATAAHAIGVSDMLISTELKNFEPVAHRLQPIGEWRGISFIEDSGGGNPVNIAASIRTFAGKNLVLFVGGYRPHLTADEVAEFLRALQEKNSVHTVILFGQVRHELAALILDATHGTIPVVMAEGLPEAFGWVQERANELCTLPAPIVCMTPGFESYDQYKDYRVRAAHFVSLFHELC